MSFSAEKKVLQSGAVATGNGNTVNVAGKSKIGIQVTGITVATVTFEATIDGTNWVALSGSNVASAAAITSLAADGIFSANVGGLLLVRARVSAWTSGTVVATALVSEY
jgi:hypothetical protein